MPKKLIITGGAGFIGSAVIRAARQSNQYQVLNVDKLTYAGNLESLSEFEGDAGYEFRQLDICDKEAIQTAFREFQPDGVLHLAAESHVDRSIDGPAVFVETNVTGTLTLLEVATSYWRDHGRDFLFHHISTDEVYGSLGKTGLFSETTPYQPNSPYSASKASSDHLVRAWFHTYGLPTVVTNCSNNYGPRQFPEKLIPLVILNALEGKPLPIYGKGENVRDWLFVEDHASALMKVFAHGKTGETYNIGGRNEMSNLDVVHTICDLLDKNVPSPTPRRELIQFVADRPGHDFRYAIDCSKIQNELQWTPAETFESGIGKTIQWYIENREGWCKRVQDGSYSRERLGLTPQS